MKPEISVSFVIAGDFSPDEITSALEITPAKVWKKGNKRPKTKIVEKESGWLFSTDLSTYSLEIDDYLQALLKALLPKSDIIKRFCTKNKLDAGFEIWIDVIDETPIMVMNPGTISGIAALNASIVIDIVLTE